MTIHWSADITTASAVCRESNAGHLVCCSALEFMGRRHDAPSKHCAACFVLAEKVVNSTPRTDSDRYAELRKLVEAFQRFEPLAWEKLQEWRHR